MRFVAMLMSVLLTVLAAGCDELTLFESDNPKRTLSDFDLRGVWIGEIDSKPMRMEIIGDDGRFEGVLFIEVVGERRRTQITGISIEDGNVLEMDVVLPGTRATVLVLRGGKSGKTLTGEYSQQYEIGLSATGIWKAVKDPLQSTIYGTWSWVQSVGGIAGRTLQPPPVVRIQYSPDGMFYYYRNDTLIAATRFLIGQEIRYEDSLRLVPQTFTILGDTLELNDLCVDCFDHWYSRMQR